MSYGFNLSTPLIALSLILDLLLGDPEWLPHPARMMGATISHGESVLRTGDPQQDLRAGAILTIAVVALSASLAWSTIAVLGWVHPALAATAAVLIGWTTLAARGLDSAAREVQEALARNDEVAARAAMPALVGRDPKTLERGAMIRATVESVAENSSDGVIAPLIFLFVAGPVGAIAYKAINTLDSMIGHRDERYAYFGRFAARLDDVANWIPSRAAALCIIAASELWLCRGRFAYSICRRDARAHESPNSGYPEAAMAGGLGIQLGGPAIYDGEKIPRALLGDAECPITIDDIASARMIFKIATAIAFLATSILRVLL
jgi:adenosylcobinamide-phosphate synthase